MAKLDRKDVKIFAENSKETLITEFRTEDSEGNTASFSRDPDVIQNENYSQGWVNDTNNLNTKIYGEDLNAVNYVLSYLLKYLYENGIAEWKSTTTYYQNSICKVDNALYLSLQNNNIGNDPTSTVSYWKLIPLENVSIEDAGSGFSIVKDVMDNVITFKTISVTGYGEITDNGDQLNIDIAGGGGGGGGDAYWGTIRGTITNQTDLMALINLKQDIFTVDSPLVLTDEQHLTINKATSSVSGYLDYNDFNTFNGKQDTISATLPISITNNNIEIETADTSTTGALSYTDWNTFNNKQDKIQGVQFYYDDSILKQEPDSNRTSYLGSDLHPYNNAYVDNINAVTITNEYTYVDNISFSNDSVANHYINYNAGTNANNAGVHVFKSGGDVKLAVFNDAIKSYVDIVPNANDTFNLGNSNSTRFHQLWVQEIHMRVGITPEVNPNSVYIGTSTAKIGDIYCTRINGTNYTPSDETKKENIVKRDNSTKGKTSLLDSISNIETYTFNYKDDEEKTTHLGIMAQDLQKFIPECVVNKKQNNKKGEEEESDLYIDTFGYITVLTEAIKELNAKVEALEARIEELEGNKKELEK